LNKSGHAVEGSQLLLTYHLPCKEKKTDFWWNGQNQGPAVIPGTGLGAVCRNQDHHYLMFNFIDSVPVTDGCTERLPWDQ
jgi:hypothetical protein